jgi:hypothetical protein
MTRSADMVDPAIQKPINERFREILYEKRITLTEAADFLGVGRFRLCSITRNYYRASKTLSENMQKLSNSLENLPRKKTSQTFREIKKTVFYDPLTEIDPETFSPKKES